MNNLQFTQRENRSSFTQDYTACIWSICRPDRERLKYKFGREMREVRERENKKKKEEKEKRKNEFQEYPG